MLRVTKTFLFALALVARVVMGQISAPECTNLGWNWTYNSLQQSPCLVGAYIGSVCDSGHFSVDSLPPGQHYTGPLLGNSSPCLCNTVTYSLFSACSACQGGVFPPWSEWHLNCTLLSPDGVLQVDIPSGTKVPQWAYQNLSATDIWSNVTASRVGDGVESAGPASTATVQTTSSHRKSNIGPIVGGVVGGVCGAILLTFAIGFIIIRQRRHRLSHTAPSALFTQQHGSYPSIGGGAPLLAKPDAPTRFYNPSDPSTFPPMSTMPHSPPVHVTHMTQEPMYGENGFILQPNRVYTGLPEV